MKITKVKRMRIGVGRREKRDGRSILYETPKLYNGQIQLETQVARRIEQANRLYQVFYADNSAELEEHFKRIAGYVAGKKDWRAAARAMETYTGYTKKGDPDERKISSFPYKGSGAKKPERAMALHVQERMTEEWHTDGNKQAACAILLCICDGRRYAERIKRLPVEIKRTFWEACRSCRQNAYHYPEIYVEKSTRLEQYFSTLMKKIAKEYDRAAYESGDAEKIKAALNRQISWMANLQEVEVWERKVEKSIRLDTIAYPYATEERLRAVLVRMRRSLKRGSDADIAVQLLQGLAQMDGKSWKKVMDELSGDPQKREQLCHFIDSVNRDYHKTEILKSLKQIDVKVQPYGETKGDRLLDLSSVSRGLKKAVNETLVRYASSSEGANQVLREIKAILFEYFPTECDAEPYLKEDRLWKFPHNEMIYLDYTWEEGEQGETLERLWDDSEGRRPKLRAVKDRIKYVNYGIYLRCLGKETDDFRKYWLSYIKNFVESNYTGTRKILRESSTSSAMMAACWADIIRFLCSKYIDLGKAVYHFAMPLDMDPRKPVRYGIIRPEFQDGLSSFAYETIKAEESLQRHIAIAAMAASSAFSASIIDESKRAAKVAANEAGELEDVLMMKLEQKEFFQAITKSNTEAQLLRFYGGRSSVSGEVWNHGEAEWQFVQEVQSHLQSVRNANFHYTEGKRKSVSVTYASALWENDRNAYADLTRKKYYSNNVAMFYALERIQELVGALYQKEQTAEAQIPAFRTIWKRREELPKYIKEVIRPEFGDQQIMTIYEGALYFLLKEMYYRDFILSDRALGYFFNAVEAYVRKNRENKKHGRAVQNFGDYIDQLKKNQKNFSFGNICQIIMQEYSQQNTKEADEAIYQHFRMLFPICLREGFQKYVRDQYGWLLKPVYREISGEQSYLQDVPVGCMNVPDDEDAMTWYTFAHFIHPRQLNHLVGDFKNYIQYRKDIVKRADSAGQFADDAERRREESALAARVSRAEAILKVLDFVRGVAGRVSNVFEDYYEDKEAYARFLNQYIDFKVGENKTVFESLKYFCQHTLPGDVPVDLYADAENPKVLRNVEIARMYAGGDLPLAKRKKVSADEIRTYYQEKSEVEAILSRGLCASREEQQKVTTQQQRRGRLTLNDVTDLYALTNDMMGQLISLAYLRERDELYLYLGFYYMALRAENPESQWPGEILDTVETNTCHVEGGLVLYQIAAAYDYGKELLYPRKKDNTVVEWKKMGGEIGKKYGKVDDIHKSSFRCARRLFGEDAKLDAAVRMRNYVDHCKYYANHDKSILQLYGEFYDGFFWYSKKLRRSVLHNFQTILEDYFIESKIDTKNARKDAQDGTVGFGLSELKSAEFTYKLQGGGKVKGQARNEAFVRELQAMLEYKRG